MESVKKLKRLIAVYLSILIVLLLSVIATPLIIRHDMALTATFIIAEEKLETGLIVILFGLSYLILRAFLRALRAYQRAVVRTGNEKSRLISRLADAFNYIGTVNVEIQEIQSIICGIEYYPRTKKEFKALFERLAAKAMAVAGTPWTVIRVISRFDGRTIKEQGVDRGEGSLPSATVGNREILAGSRVKSMQTIASCQKNLDLLTVCILPMPRLSEEGRILITAIVNQTELLFLLYRTGCFQQNLLDNPNGKEVRHDIHY